MSLLNTEYACPKCGSKEGLWEGVEIAGWRSVNSQLKPIGSGMDREAMWDNAVPDGTVGCGECDWEGWVRDLVKTDQVTGEHVPEPIPGQMKLPA